LNIDLEELKDLQPPSASEIISEVQDHCLDIGGDLNEVEGAIAPDQDTVDLIEEVIQIAADFKPIHEKLKTIVEKGRCKISCLKSAFGVRQGCAGHPLIIAKQTFTWEEFVQTYFGVTPRRLNQLLDSKDEKDTRRTVVKTPDEEKELYKKGKAAGKAEADRELTAMLLETKPSPVVMPDAKGDVYAYFHQLRDEKETFSFELAAMVLEMYDTVDAESISKLFLSELRKQIADARKASLKSVTA
jgi:hypothetical protein